MIIKEEEEVEVQNEDAETHHVVRILAWSAVPNFFIFILVSAISCRINYEIGSTDFGGILALFIPLIIWVIFKVDLIKKMPKNDNTLRYLSFLPLIIFMSLSPFRLDITEYFYFNLWIISNVILFEFSNRIGINIIFKILGFILLTFIALPQLYSGVPYAI
jgi:hypothetical protein